MQNKQEKILQKKTPKASQNTNKLALSRKKTHTKMPELN